MTDKMWMHIWAWIFRKLAKRGYFAWLQVGGRWYCPEKFSISMGQPQPLRLDCEQTPKKESSVQP